MIELKEVTTGTGLKIEIPCYDLHHKKLNFLLSVWGIDFDKVGYEWYFNLEVEVMLIGKLNTATYLNDYVPIALLRQVLIEAGWDFVQYPNPELIIVRERRSGTSNLKIIH